MNLSVNSLNCGRIKLSIFQALAAFFMSGIKPQPPIKKREPIQTCQPIVEEIVPWISRSFSSSSQHKLAEICLHRMRKFVEHVVLTASLSDRTSPISLLCPRLCLLYRYKVWDVPWNSSPICSTGKFIPVPILLIQLSLLFPFRIK